MVIAQLLTVTASELDRKHQDIDARQLRLTDQVSVYAQQGSGWRDEGGLLTDKELLLRLAASSIIHIYGAQPFPLLSRLTRPYVCSFAPPPSRWPWRRHPAPAHVIPPAGREALPEAVDERYFLSAGDVVPDAMIGSYVGRPEVRSVVDRTLPRIGRLRDDVSWRFFEAPPTPSELRSVALWVDAAVTETHTDGFTAEAMAVGLPVVASRIPMNELRLDRGTAGLLVKPGDPNELTHAVLSVLFKPEFINQRMETAHLIASRFRPEHRAAKLRAMYARIIT